MRLSEFVAEAAPNIAQRFGSKLLAKLPYGYKSRGQVQTNTTFVQVWDKFKTWMGRSGYQFLNSVEGMKDQKPIKVDKISDKRQLWLSNNKILTSEMFKKIFAKTPHLDQAIKEEGITSNVTLTEKQVKNILHNAIQLKASAPPPPDAGEERQKKTQEQFDKVVDKIKNLSDTSSLTVLDPKESKKLETAIKAEVSKSRQKATEIGIQLLQLSKKYNVEQLAELWIDAVNTGIEWETLKEVQTKVNLSET
jgi:hypothetical protein